MKFNPNQRYTRWSIRRLSVGVASVVVASGFFVLVGQPSSVRADGLNPTPAQVLPEGESVTKKGDLVETQGDTVLAEAKPEAVAGNTNSLSTPTERTKVSEETSPSRLDTLFEKGEEAQENPDLTDVLKEAVDTADVDGTQASPEDIKKAVDEDVNDTIDVPAAYLEQAKASGPFLAGVNKPLKYELFAGDGMLTRLLLKASDKAPWSDNGVAQNEKIPPVKNLPDGKYYYQVSLNGNTEGKKDQDLLDTLRTNGTNTYEATLTVYEADGDKPDLTKVVKTRNVNITLNGLVTKSDVKSAVENNVKDSIDVPAAYLEQAKGEGPFTAGVNQVIPYELFAGDGMLTRLLLKASDKAPWSDNGTAKNPALSPLGENVKTKGQYFYEVDLNGNTVGKQGQDLIDQLRANGTQTYKATVKVYGNKDGKADLTNLVATKNVDININGLVAKETVEKAVKDNVKDSIDVPAAYLEKAEGKGPFTAGVNQVIPYELFAGDGMLTRLLLKASDKAPWSDNGVAKNPALSPLGENVKTKGQYFYEVDLNGNTVGKQGQALIDQLRANGTQTYNATVKVYGNKDGKADLTNIVATKQVTIKINVKETSGTANGSFSPSNSGSGVTPMNHNHATGATHQTAADHKDMMAPAKETDKAMPANDQMEKSGMKTETPAPGTTDSMPADTMTSSTNTMAGENMAASANKMSDTMMSDKMMSDDKAMLPNTGEAQTSMASIGFLGLALAGLLGGLGLKNKKEEN